MNCEENNSGENNLGENNEDIIIETSNQLIDNNISEENEDELKKMDTFKEKKNEFLQKLKKDDKIIKKVQTIEERMKNLVEKATKYAHYLVSRHERGHKRRIFETSQKKRGNKSHLQEEEEMLNEEEEENIPTFLYTQPSIIKGGQLRDFQINGLNWLISLYEGRINGILADEMGLGKTIQTIALLAFLKQYKKIYGPHLIIAPKSTLGNWMNELKKWLPCARIVKLIAVKQEREEILKNYLKPGKFDICLTSYEGANICKAYLGKFKWNYIIIDEAHRIKNEESILSMSVRSFQTNYKLLLTGTPLQNNLHELWSLLNFLMPDIFDKSDIFDNWFSLQNDPSLNLSTEEQEKKNMEIVLHLHHILRPFLLRRTKKEVDKSIPPKKEIYLYVGLTKCQVEIYKNLLLKKNLIGEEGKNHYLNIIMQLRKVCNHPYLFEGVEEEGLPILGEHLIHNSGKLIVLDKLLTKLHKEVHQVLIFSQMTSVLDILEDYCNFRQFKYCRIDGDTDMILRDNQIAEFSKEGSEIFVFLLSTRAGGLGINLATADTVVLYDSDWNPQMDLQAMDRVHRIGQKNLVNVYRLITENTIEEKMIERQIVKLKWDSLVIQQGKLAQKNKSFSREQLKEMIQFGASEIFRSSSGTITDHDIESLLQRGEEKAKTYISKLDSEFERRKNVLDLSLSNFDLYNFQNVNYLEKKKNDQAAISKATIDEIDKDYVARTRREKKNLFDDTIPQMPLNSQPIRQQLKVKVQKLPDFQLFCNKERLNELLLKEAEYKHSKKSNKMDVEEEVDENNEVLYLGLTKEEIEEKEALLATGFINWNKQEYNSFLQGCEKFGRNCFKEISEHIGTKSEEEVISYSKVFWEKIDDIPDKEKILKIIEKGERILNERKEITMLLNKKCKSYKNPREDIEIYTSYYTKFKDKFFNYTHDRLLIYYSWLIGSIDKLINRLWRMGKNKTCY